MIRVADHADKKVIHTINIGNFIKRLTVANDIVALDYSGGGIEWMFT